MDIFGKNEIIISDVINRILNCKQTKKLYVREKSDPELKYLYPAIELLDMEKTKIVLNELIYFRAKDENDLIYIDSWINANGKDNDFIVYYPDEIKGICESLDRLGTPYPINEFSGLKGCLFLKGKTFEFAHENPVPDSFHVLAIVHFYNEADILSRTIEYLLSQEIDIYLIDNWSNDGSYEIAEKYQSMYPEKIFLEHFPLSGKNDYYEWYNQLERTETISKNSDYDWYIHYDVDEMRCSPWRNITLRKAIYHIDQLGYNCVENTVIDFRLTVPGQSNIFMKDTFFDFRHKRLWFDQVKTWKKTRQIDLKSSGGHFAHVENPRIFPLKILNRHYPLRSVEQARKKVFTDRLPRFEKEKSERGWHGHYNRFQKDDDFFLKHPN